MSSAEVLPDAEGLDLNDETPMEAYSYEELPFVADARVPLRLWEHLCTSAAASLTLLVEELVAIGTPAEARARLRTLPPIDRADDPWAAFTETVEAMSVDELGQRFKPGLVPVAAMPSPWAYVVGSAAAPVDAFAATLVRQRELRGGGRQASPGLFCSGSADVPRGVGIPNGTTEARTAPSPRARLRTWMEVMRHLSITSNAVLGVCKQAQCRRLPRQLRHRLLPVVYAWVTDFNFMVCGDYYWSVMVALFHFVAVRDDEGATVPWRPIVALALSVWESKKPGDTLSRFAAVHEATARYLPRIMRLASRCFDASALPELWDFLSPHLGEDNPHAAVYLFILTQLLPIQHACDPATGLASAPVAEIMRFLWQDAIDWQLCAPRGWAEGRNRFLAILTGPHPGLLDMDSIAAPFFTSLLASLQLVDVSISGTSSARATCEEGVTDALSVMGLLPYRPDQPLAYCSVAIACGLPARTDSPLWNQLRRFLHLTSVFIRPASPLAGKRSTLFAFLAAIVHYACVRLRQLTEHSMREELQACAALRRETAMGGAEGGVAARRDADTEFEDKSARELDPGHGNALPRVGSGMLLGDFTGFAVEDELEREWGNSELGEESLGDGTPRPRHRRPLPDAHRWSRDTVDTFAALFMPYLLPAFTMGLDKGGVVLANLLFLSPALVMRGLQTSLDAALSGATGGTETQRGTALELLKAALPALLACEETARLCPSYLAGLLPSAIAWMSPSQPGMNVAVSHLVTSVVCALSPARDLFESLDAEREVMTAYARAMAAWLTDGADVPSAAAASLGLVMRALSQETYAHIMDHVLLPQACSREAKRPLLNALAYCRRPAGSPVVTPAPVAGGRVVVTVIPAGDPNAERFMRIFRDVVAPVLLSASVSKEHLSWALDLAQVCLMASGRATVFADAELVRRCVRTLIAQLRGPASLSVAHALLTTFVRVLRAVDAAEAVGVGGQSDRTPAPSAPEDGAGAEPRRGDAPGDAGSSSAAVVASPVTAHCRVRPPGYCRAEDVKLLWDVAQPQHMKLIMDFYDDFVDEANFALKHAKHAHRPANLADGLRGVCATCTDNAAGGGQGAHRGSGVTPRELLHYTLRWLHCLYDTFHFLHMESEGEAVVTRPTPSLFVPLPPDLSLTVLGHKLPAVGLSPDSLSAVTMWPRLVVPVEVPPAGGSRVDPTVRVYRPRTPKYTQVHLAMMVLRHVVQPSIGEAVLAELTAGYGPAAAALVDVSLFKKETRPSDLVKADAGDVTLFKISLYALLNFAGLGRITFDITQKMCDVRATDLGLGKVLLETLPPHRPLRGELPRQLWEVRARLYVGQCINPRKLPGSAVIHGLLYNYSVLLSLLFPDHAGLLVAAKHCMQACELIMPPALFRIALASIACLAKGLACCWLQHTGGELALFRSRLQLCALVTDHSVITSGTTAEPPSERSDRTRSERDEGAAAVGEAGDTARARGGGAQCARHVAQLMCRLTVSLFNHSWAFPPADVLFMLLQTMMWYPDGLLAEHFRAELRGICTAARVWQMCVDESDTGCTSEKKSVTHCTSCAATAPCASLPRPTAPLRQCNSVRWWLVEQTIFLAHQLHSVSSRRALACLRIASYLYLPASLPHCRRCGRRFVAVGDHEKGGILPWYVFRALFGLCLSTSPEVHITAAGLLESALTVMVAMMRVLPTKVGGPHREVWIDVALRSPERTAADRSPAAVSEFRRRLATLQHWYPLLTLDGRGQHFIPAAVRVPVWGHEHCSQLLHALATECDSLPPLSHRPDTLNLVSFFKPPILSQAGCDKAWDVSMRPVEDDRAMSATWLRLLQLGTPFDISPAEMLHVSIVRSMLMRLSGIDHFLIQMESGLMDVSLTWIYRLLCGYRDVFESSRGYMQIILDLLVALGHLLGGPAIACVYIRLAFIIMGIGDTSSVTCMVAILAGMRATKAAGLRLVQTLMLAHEKLMVRALQPGIPCKDTADSHKSRGPLAEVLITVFTQMLLSGGTVTTPVSPIRLLEACLKAEELAKFICGGIRAVERSQQQSHLLPMVSAGRRSSISRDMASDFISLTCAVNTLAELIAAISLAKRAVVLPCLVDWMSGFAIIFSGRVGEPLQRGLPGLFREVFASVRQRSDIIPGNAQLVEVLVALGLRQLTDALRPYVCAPPPRPRRPATTTPTPTTAEAAVALEWVAMPGIAPGPRVAPPLRCRPPLLRRRPTTGGSCPAPAPPSPPCGPAQAGEPDGCARVATLRVVCLSWRMAPSVLIAACHRPLMEVLARSLDIVLTETDSLVDTARATALSVVQTDLPKATVHDMLNYLCDVLEGRTVYGQSWRARLELTSALEVLVLRNTHRIGKYVLMQRIGEAALHGMAHQDGRLQAAAQQLFAVLTRVASVKQTQATVRSYVAELRTLGTGAGGTRGGPVALARANGSAPAPVAAEAGARVVGPHRRAVALVLALSAVVAADPGGVPPYIPSLMERLVPYATGRLAGVEGARAVKRAFEHWWRAHREGWEVTFKHCFTAGQREAMSALLTAPSYYV